MSQKLGCLGTIILSAVVLACIGKIMGLSDSTGYHPSDDDSYSSDSVFMGSTYNSSDYISSKDQEVSLPFTAETSEPEMSKSDFIKSCKSYSDSDFQSQGDKAVGEHVKVKLMVGDKSGMMQDKDILGNYEKTYWTCNIYNKKYDQYASHPLYFENTGTEISGHTVELYDKLTIYGIVESNDNPITLRNDGSISVPIINVKYIKYEGKFGK